MNLVIHSGTTPYDKQHLTTSNISHLQRHSRVNVHCAQNGHFTLTPMVARKML